MLALVDKNFRTGPNVGKAASHHVLNLTKEEKSDEKKIKMDISPRGEIRLRKKNYDNEAGF